MANTKKQPATPKMGLFSVVGNAIMAAPKAAAVAGVIIGETADAVWQNRAGVARLIDTNTRNLLVASVAGSEELYENLLGKEAIQEQDLDKAVSKARTYWHK